MVRPSPGEDDFFSLLSPIEFLLPPHREGSQVEHYGFLTAIGSFLFFLKDLCFCEQSHLSFLELSQSPVVLFPSVPDKVFI